MTEVEADVVLPVPPVQAFEVATDFDHADWLPAVRGLRHVGGPERGVGARYEVEVGMVGRHLRGVLVCRELQAPERAVYGLEEGLELSIIITVVALPGGCKLTISARYGIRGALGAAAERAAVGTARREVARAVEQLAARLARKSEV